jgi:hypothetical protein
MRASLRAKAATRVVVLPAIVVLFFAGCLTQDPSAPENPSLNSVRNNNWVAIEPTQCLTNPWEKDWLARNKASFADYPKDPNRPGLELEELKIIKDFYARQDIIVLDATTRKKYDSVCAACTCPEGHTLYLQVRPQDVKKMSGLGYRLEVPRPSSTIP